MIYAQVPIDAGSLAEPFFAPDAKAFMHDAKAFGALAHSVKVDASMAGKYDAVCLCGGHGTCVDFYGSSAAALKAVVEGTYAAGKIVGAVCHGPIGLRRPVRKSTSASGRPRGIIYYSGRLDAGREWRPRTRRLRLTHPNV